MGKWISVKERLPEDDAECLLVVPIYNAETRSFLRKDVYHGNFCAQENMFTTCDGEDFEDGDVTHWQHLEQPPDGE